MADYEVSKLMWMGIVVALAASIFVVAKPQIQTQAASVFDKVNQVVKGTSTSDTAPPAKTTHWEVQGADSTPVSGETSNIEMTLPGGVVVGHASSNGLDTKLMFDTEAAKDIDFTKVKFINFSAPVPNVMAMVSFEGLPEVQNGEKVESNVALTFNGTQLSVNLEPDSKARSLYGAVISYNVGGAGGAPTSSITSHFVEVEDN